jgi:hypothetical protein
VPYFRKYNLEKLKYGFCLSKAECCTPYTLGYYTLGDEDEALGIELTFCEEGSPA